MFALDGSIIDRKTEYANLAQKSIERCLQLSGQCCIAQRIRASTNYLAFRVSISNMDFSKKFVLF
jgi:hypothetical protein